MRQSDKPVMPQNTNILAFSEKRVRFFEFKFLQTYLYGLATGALSDGELTVTNIGALSSFNGCAIVAPRISSMDENGLATVDNNSIFANVQYKGQQYQVSVYLRITEDRRGCEHFLHFISVYGVQTGSSRTDELAAFFLRQAISNSRFKNKIVKMKFEDEGYDIIEVKTEEFSSETFEKIFVPGEVKEEFDKFCLCVENYHKLPCGLRYLLSGEPGTGKTKSIRALMNKIRGKATIVLAEGEINFRDLFEFAGLFKPAVVCFDDLDLLIGNRSEHTAIGNSLGTFLQELDGFEKNEIYVLASTNDKELIDMAAQRPGRFDLILDFGRLDLKNYKDLIRENCKSQSVIDLFTDEVLEQLNSRRVTGAFLVNLVKQIEIKALMQPEHDLKAYLEKMFGLSYKGFYKKAKEREFEFGFNGG
jgi:cell division protease FtsH